MFTLKRLIDLISFVLMCFALVNCSVLGKPSVSPQPSLTPIVTLPSLTSTQNPTISPTPTLPEMTPTQTIRATPLPTLLPEDAENLVLQLLEINGDCKLPCWWGFIVPGKTKWEDTNRFLQTFATKVRLNSEKNGLQLWTAYFTVPNAVRLSEELIASINVRDGIVEQLLVGQPYALTDLLQENGKPDDVRLEISGDTFEAFSSEGRFKIVLFWEDKGILAVYRGRIEKTNPLKLCMNKIEKEAPVFWLWDPARQRTMEEVGGELLFGTPPFLPKFHLLQEVINIEIEDFFQTYASTNNINICFEIVASFLP
jgi:hypothetical protein